MSLEPAPFLHRQAAEHGVSPAQLRQPVWYHPSEGVAMPARDRGDPHRECAAIQLVLPPHSVFTHVTAARLRGWWLPSALRRLPVIACTDGDAPHHNRRGVYVRRCAVPAAHRTTLGGLRIASAEWTIIELAESLGLIDLVVVIDGALHMLHCTADSIRSAMVPGRRGVRVLRRALALVDERSESPWETILRLVHTLSGIDCVQPQFIVNDLHGMFVARVDLRIGSARRAHEYDGANHRERLQHQSDLRREKGLARLDWERFGYTAVEIRGRPAQIIADAEDALGWPRDPARVGGWLAEYVLSSLSDAGGRALHRRMRRFVRDRSPRSATAAPSGAIRMTSGAGSSRTGR